MKFKDVRQLQYHNYVIVPYLSKTDFYKVIEISFGIIVVQNINKPSQIHSTTIENIIAIPTSIKLLETLKFEWIIDDNFGSHYMKDKKWHIFIKNGDFFYNTGKLENGKKVNYLHQLQNFHSYISEEYLML